MGRLLVLLLMLLVVCSCARHTYYVELTDGERFYVDPPLILDTDAGVYHMTTGNIRRTVAMDSVRYIDDAAQICFQNTGTETYTCFGAPYPY